MFFDYPFVCYYALKVTRDKFSAYSTLNISIHALPNRIFIFSIDLHVALSYCPVTTIIVSAHYFLQISGVVVLSGEREIFLQHLLQYASISFCNGGFYKKVQEECITSRFMKLAKVLFEISHPLSTYNSLGIKGKLRDKRLNLRVVSEADVFFSRHAQALFGKHSMMNKIK